MDEYLKENYIVREYRSVENTIIIPRNYEKILFKMNKNECFFHIYDEYIRTLILYFKTNNKIYLKIKNLDFKLNLHKYSIHIESYDNHALIFNKYRLISSYYFDEKQKKYHYYWKKIKTSEEHFNEFYELYSRFKYQFRECDIRSIKFIFNINNVKNKKYFIHFIIKKMK